MSNIDYKAKIILKFDMAYPDNNQTKYFEKLFNGKKSNVSNLYLTDLNFLVPVALKVLNAIEEIVFTKDACRDDVDFHIAYKDAILNIKGFDYQPLFNEVYNGIVYYINYTTKHEQHRL